MADECLWLVCPATRQSVLIDPGAEPDRLSEMLADTQPVGILVTHTHPDHIGAMEEMRARLQVPVMAHPGPHWGGLELAADRQLDDGDEVQVGEHRLKVHHTPGHIDDIICFAIAGTSGSSSATRSLKAGRARPSRRETWRRR